MSQRYYHELRQYNINDSDDGSDPKYYGYTNSEGWWYILKETTLAGSYRYARGISGYAAAWAARTSQIYLYYDVIF